MTRNRALAGIFAALAAILIALFAAPILPRILPSTPAEPLAEPTYALASGCEYWSSGSSEKGETRTLKSHTVQNVTSIEWQKPPCGGVYFKIPSGASQFVTITLEARATCKDMSQKCWLSLTLQNKDVREVKELAGDTWTDVSLTIQRGMHCQYQGARYCWFYTLAEAQVEGAAASGIDVDLQELTVQTRECYTREQHVCQ